jgi:sec-independent protein translocase protein TatA
MHSFLALFGPIGWPELLVILVLVLVVFGPRRLPEIADAMGKSIRKFRDSSREATREVQRELNETKRSLDETETAAKEKPRSDEPRP